MTPIRELLSNIADTERIAARISTLRASPRDLLGLARTLRQVPKLRQLLGGLQAGLNAQLAQQCDSMDELADLLESAVEPDCPTHLRDGGVIRNGFSQELDRLRSISTDGQSWLRNYQKQEAQRTGIANLKVGFNKVFGYYIEITNASADKVPADYIRKQTVKNAERYITEELKELRERGAHRRGAGPGIGAEAVRGPAGRSGPVHPALAAARRDGRAVRLPGLPRLHRRPAQLQPAESHRRWHA